MSARWVLAAISSLHLGIDATRPRLLAWAGNSCKKVFDHVQG